NTTVDQLYTMSKNIWSKYVSATDNYITVCAADTIYTYFQDKLGKTHYLYVIGDNETGKTAYGSTMKSICYRPFSSGSFSDAVLYRSLGFWQEGQVSHVF